MSTRRQYIRNSVCNYGAFFINIVITFLMTPFVISSLGDSLYGYWTVIVASTGYFGFLDFGVRAGVGQYVTRYLASKDYRSYNEVVGTSLVSLAAIGCLGVVMSLLLATVLCAYFFDESILTPSFKLSLFIVGLAISLKFPFVIFQAILQGIHRYDITGGIGVACKCVNSFCVFLVLFSGHGVLGLAIVTLSTQLLEGAVTVIAALRKVPQTKLALVLAPSRLREITGYGIFSFWNNLADQITFYLGPILVGQQLGAVAVTYYSVAANIMPYLVNLVQAASTPLMQIATGYDARGEDAANQKLYMAGTRYLFWMVCFVGVNICIAGESFLGRWIGEKYISGIGYPSSGTVLKVLVVGYMAYLSHAVGRQILFGKRLNRFLAMAASFSALGVVAATFLLSRCFGIVGAAFGLTIPCLIVNAIILPVYTSKSIGVNYFTFFTTAIFPALATFLLTVAAMAALPFASLDSLDWVGVIIRCTATSLVFLFVTLLFYYRDIAILLKSRVAAETL